MGTGDHQGRRGTRPTTATPATPPPPKGRSKREFDLAEAMKPPRISIHNILDDLPCGYDLED